MQDFIFKRREKPAKKDDSSSIRTRASNDFRSLASFGQISATPAVLPQLILPAFSTPNFFPREDLLQNILNVFQDKSTGGIRSYCLSGTGGVGKTQIALHYAHANYEVYKPIFWIHSDTREKIDQDIDSFVNKGYGLGDKKSPQEVREAFKSWLFSNSDWLIVFDNMDDPSLLKEYWPSGKAGCILITSRNPSVIRIAGNGMEVGPFTVKEGSKFIIERIPEGSGTEEEAKQASRLMGGLPIALCHLTGYLDSTASNLADFLAIPEISALSFNLLDIHSDDMTTFNYELSFRTVFDHSLKSLLKPEYADAIQLLEILVLFDPDATSEAWLKEATSAVQNKDVLPLWLQQLASFHGQKTYAHALDVLRHRSLVSKDRNSRSLGIHRMVGWAFRRTWTQTNWQIAFTRAQVILVAAFPKQIKGRTLTSGNDLPRCRAAANHVFTLQLRYREAREAGIKLEAGIEFAELLAHCGYYLSEGGQLDLAESMLQLAREICEVELGDKPDLIMALVLNNIASIHSVMNRNLQALELNERVAAIREALLGPNSEDLGNILNNIGTNYYDLDKLEDAETYFKKALKILQNQEPVDEYNLSTLLTNAGRNYTRLGQFDKAEEFLHKALAMQLRCIGETHYFTTATFYRLCQLRVRQGNLPEAESYIDRCLAARQKAIGENDFRYAVAQHKKATLKFKQNQLDDALELLSHAIKTFQSSSGRCEGGLLVRSMSLKVKVLEEMQQLTEVPKLQQKLSTLWENLEPSLKDLKISSPDDLDLLVQPDFR